MSVTDFSFDSSSEVRVRTSFSSVMSLTLPLKSKRWRISFTACWTAFDTSIMSTSDTTSNELSPAMRASRRVPRRAGRMRNGKRRRSASASRPYCTLLYAIGKIPRHSK
jgi:hypothetical protein